MMQNSASGALVFESTFGSEGLDIYVPGNGIRFETLSMQM